MVEGTGYRERRRAFGESEIETNFDVAMSVILNGGAARRREWSRPAYVKKERRVEGMTLPLIVMVMRDGTVGPYTPSGCDMVAGDWVEVLVEPWSPGPENTAHKRGGETW